MTASGSHPANRLAHETSPYLLQHRFNPVNWFPWGEEAFSLARELDRPIFLSVGYSACHWCHVMERESFENQAIADILNRHYVCIKVDREERPDVDQIYMTAVQLITRRGGWPMSVFMNADGEPFYGGTYWPPTARMNMPGFGDILHKLHEYWTHKRDEVLTSARELAEQIHRVSSPTPGDAELTAATLESAQHSLLIASDPRHGGFRGAPKFPHPMDIRLLLRLSQRFDSAEAFAAARLALDKMAAGGIYDHLGGGFHRYSTDAQWLVPHFEKMLYDNALLVPAYIEAWQLTGNQNYATTVRETLDYILREMMQAEGGFYSTQDADSEGEEGKFFVWTAAEINKLLSAEDARIFNTCYDVTATGNWEGNTILNLPRPLVEVAEILQVAPEELQVTLERSRKILFAARSRRVPPGRDDKVLVSWNGMMIAACAQAGAVLNEPRYLTAAVASAEFIASQMRTESGDLLHSYKDNRARFMAYLDDYACFIDGLVALYQASGCSRYLELAIEFADQMLSRFADSRGGFFYTAHDHEDLITRTKDAQDNATPSGNGMAATALLKLARLTGRSDYQLAAEATLRSIGDLLNDSPLAAGQSLMALDFLLGPTFECVLIDGEEQSVDEMLMSLRAHFLPRVVIARSSPVPSAATAALFQGRQSQARPQAFVCAHGSCQQPVTTAAELLTLLTAHEAGLSFRGVTDCSTRPNE